MTRQEKTHLIESCIGKKQLVRMFFKYEKPYWYYYPNAVNDQFILGQEEDDFLLDGYHIRRIKDLVKAEIKDDLCAQINIWNGTVSNHEEDTPDEKKDAYFDDPADAGVVSPCSGR